MRLLVIDALGPTAVAGLVEGGTVRAESSADGRAEGLAALLSDLLAGDPPFDAIAVATGPGGFAGARAGVAIARGLAMARGVPSVGVSLFAALAGSADTVVTLPGGGGALWSQRFAGGVAAGPPAPADPGSAPHPDAAGSPQRLARLAAAAARRLAAGTPERPAPLYLRPPDAAAPAAGPVALLP